MDARPAGSRLNARTPTHYERLQVSPSATAEVIRAAYRALASLHHPDRRGAQPTDGDEMAAINAAYAVLGDPARRTAYDAELRSAAAGAPHRAAPLRHRRQRIVRALRRSMLRHPLRWAAGAGSATLVTVAGSVAAWWVHQQARDEHALLRAWHAGAAAQAGGWAQPASASAAVLLPSGGAAPEPVGDAATDAAAHAAADTSSDAAAHAATDPPTGPGIGSEVGSGFGSDAGSGAGARATAAATSASATARPDEAAAAAASYGELALEPTAAGPAPIDTPARAAQVGRSADGSAATGTAPRASAAAAAAGASPASGATSAQRRKGRPADEREAGSAVAAGHRQDAQEPEAEEPGVPRAELGAPADEPPPGGGHAAVPLPARPAPQQPAWTRPSPASPTLDASLRLRSAAALSLPR